MKIKYPRTPHLPWSPGASEDDIRCMNTSGFEGQRVVVTEKMDGENTSIYRGDIHARSIDSRYHPSRAWVKALQAQIGFRIPNGWRVCGENMYARHSISYRDLPSYFLAFSVWNEENVCLSWQDTQLFLRDLELETPKILYTGLWDEKSIRKICVNSANQEGYVVRLAESFHYDDFDQSVAKWVRNNHVTTNKHWMHGELIPNELAKG